MKKLSLLLLAVLAWAPLARAADLSESGSVGARWLGIPGHARSVGLAQAGLAFEGGISTVGANPAGLAGLPGLEAFFTHNQWIADTSTEHLSLGLPMGSSSGVGLGVDYFNLGTVDRTRVDAGGNLIEMDALRPYSFLAKAGYGLGVGPSLAAGAWLKMLGQRLGDSDSNAFAVDLGGRWATPFQGLALGVALQDLGTDLGPAPLPTRLKAGLAWEAPALPGLALALDAGLSMRAGDSTALAAGLEYAAAMGALRVGYAAGSAGAPAGLAAGLGLRYGALRLDYAYSATGELGATHQLTLGLSLAKPEAGQSAQLQASPAAAAPYPEASTAEPVAVAEPEEAAEDAGSAEAPAAAPAEPTPVPSVSPGF